MPDDSFGHRVHRSVRERAEMHYIKAVRAGTLQPVILVDTRNQAERKVRAEAKHDLPEELPMVHTEITIGSRSQIARLVEPMSRKAAEDIARLNPERPFTVVVIADQGKLTVQIFDEPAPEPTD